VLDVLPRALVAAASGVRAIDVRPDVVVSPCGAPRLEAAVASFCTAWSGDDLEEHALAVAALLVSSAGRYAEVESLVVPRALR